LYQVDPSGSFFAWKASAIGAGMYTAEAFLRKRYTDDISVGDAIHRAIRIIKEGYEGEMNEQNIEIGRESEPNGKRKRQNRNDKISNRQPFI